MVDPAALDIVLDEVVSQLPGGGEPRSGQRQMAHAVADAISSGRHLVIQAGTGTGKSLGYLVPAILSKRKVVVATATKALQDQLANKDLPFLAEALAPRPLTFAVVKGRSNYACLQRMREVTGATGKLDLDDSPAAVRAEISRIAAWAATSETGDRSEMAFEPTDRAWGAVSVSAAECPGANDCPMGGPCFAERARRAAAEADVVVVNLHLYGTHMAAGGMVLPEHDLVIIDEAHQLEDTISATSGSELSGGRFAAMARVTRSIVESEAIDAALMGAGARLAEALRTHMGERLRAPLPVEVGDALLAGRAAVADVLTALRAISINTGDVDQRKVRAQKAATALSDEIDAVLTVPDHAVAWVEGDAPNPRMRVAPIDVGPLLEIGLWERCPTVLTSATIPVAMPERVGLSEGDFDMIDVGSPFDYESNAVLYCAAHLSDPRKAGFDEQVHEELAALIIAAGGRTLALFTSWRAMRAAVEAVSNVVPHKVLTQADLPKPALLAAFGEDESSCLFATAGLFQGVDIPGRTLSLVTIDRIPFPRPDEPLMQARRDLAGANAFREVDLPRAATLLAQAAGRLIRSASDRGVVAVFDPRLASAGYRWDIVNALPPMRRTKNRADAEEFLRTITA